MSYQATSWAASQRTGNPTLKAILFAIANRANVGEWRAWPKLETIAIEADVSKRTVQRGLEKLKAMGLIEIVPRYRADGGQIQSDILMLRDSPTIAPGATDDAPPVTPMSPPHGQQVATQEESSEPSIEIEERTPAFAEARTKPGDAEIDLIFEERFWPAYPKRDGFGGKPEAARIFRKIVKAGEDVEKIIAGAIEHAEHWGPRVERKPSEAKFIKQAANWMRARGWEDERPEPSEACETIFDLVAHFEQRRSQQHHHHANASGEFL
jgi:hypothetical protein